MTTLADDPPAQTPVTLSERINHATHSQHTTLNRLITSRLPLCLPPHASEPDAYLLGLAQIAELFYSFESAWDEVTSTSQLPSLENTWDSLETYPHPFAQPHAGNDPLLAGLRALRPMGVARSGRLKNDLEYLRCVCGIPEDDVRSVVTESIKLHIETEVRANPHLLVAYAWTLYLAVFSGGRHIRTWLCDAGENFWLGRGSISKTQPETVTSSETQKSIWNWRSPVARLVSSSSKNGPSKSKSKKPRGVDELRTFEAKGLSFWFFPGSNDGEELRAEFKQNVHELEGLLSAQQKDEIVAEAQAVFSRIEALVSELDAAITAGKDAVPPPLSDLSQHKDLHSQDPVIDEPTNAETEKVVEVTPVPVKLTQFATQNDRWHELSNYAGLALVICGISYCAMYYGGAWSI